MKLVPRTTPANRVARTRVTPPLISDLAARANRSRGFVKFYSPTTKQSTWTDAHIDARIMPRVEIAMTAKCATAKK